MASHVWAPKLHRSRYAQPQEDGVWLTSSEGTKSSVWGMYAQPEEDSLWLTSSDEVNFYFLNFIGESIWYIYGFIILKLGVRYSHSSRSLICMSKKKWMQVKETKN